MSALTLLTALLVVLGATTRLGYARALALSGSTVAGSAIVSGTIAVPTFYALALGAPIALAERLRAARESGTPVIVPPGAGLLAVFFLWSTMVTLSAPLLFEGLHIITPTAKRLVAGVVTASNVAQIGYLFLGVCIVVYLAGSSGAGPSLIGLIVAPCILLSGWRYLVRFGVSFPEGLFDNSPSFAYIQTSAGGAERFRGILPEPSALAGISLVALAYFLPRAAQVHGVRRVATLALAALALFLGLESTSTTFLIAGVASALIIGVTWLVAFLARRSELNRALLVGICGVVALGIWSVPRMAAFVETAVSSKLLSSSYAERTTANVDSFGVFLDSYGFGVGLGAARASSFIPTLMSATGIVGSVLFAVAVMLILARAAGVVEYRPVAWALVTFLVTKIVAGPDLSDGSGVLWISLGLLARAAMRSPRPVAPLHFVRAAQPPPPRLSPVRETSQA